MRQTRRPHHQAKHQGRLAADIGERDEEGEGRIVQCSSILGIIPYRWRGAYTASKFALEGLSLTLRMELEGSGVQVSLIEPGPIESRFTANALAAIEAGVRQVQGTLNGLGERCGQGMGVHAGIPFEGSLRASTAAMKRSRCGLSTSRSQSCATRP